MERLARWLPDLVITALVLCLLYQLWRWARESESPRGRFPKLLIDLLPGSIAVWLLAATALKSALVGNLFDTFWRTWIRAGGLITGFLVAGVFVCALLWRRVPRFQPERRNLLLVARTALFAAPVAVTGFGMFIQRREYRVQEVNLPIRNLPRDLDGLRLIQLSDIHLSPFLSEQDLIYIVNMANETRPGVALVTGDLISNPGDPLDACIQRLAALKAPAGIWGCLGNHERFAQVEDYTTIQSARRGIRFLRQDNVELRFGSATLNLAGVDYQKKDAAYLEGAETLIRPGAANLLLSHNPDVFKVAVTQGWQGVLAGHTHGGQVNVEILNQNMNVARFFTPYVYGLYREPESAIYVTRGIGTIGMPVRLGAPPEIALIRLCAT